MNLSNYEDTKRGKEGGQEMLRDSPLHGDAYLDIMIAMILLSTHVSCNDHKFCHIDTAQVNELSWNQIHEFLKLICISQ